MKHMILAAAFAAAIWMPITAADAQDASQNQRMSPAEAELIVAEKVVRMVMEQVSPCWVYPTKLEGLGVRIVIELWVKPDGTYFEDPKVLNFDRVKQNPYSRALAISALRALRNPNCKPLKLPIEHYSVWKRIHLTFQSN